MEEEEGVKSSSKLHLIWDDTDMDDIYDDVMEEDCVGNDYNIQSKGASTSNNFSSTLKPAMKNSYCISLYIKGNIYQKIS